jgi:hypothetical protein
MKTLFPSVARPVAALCAASAVRLFTVWVLLTSFSSSDGKADLHDSRKARVLATSPLSWACAATAGWSTWRIARAILRPQDVLLCAILGALLVGVIGFAGSLLGTARPEPYANQASLLGTFLIGPLGWALGFIGGALYALAKRKHEVEKQVVAQLLSGEVDPRPTTHFGYHLGSRTQKSASSC